MILEVFVIFLVGGFSAGKSTFECLKSGGTDSTECIAEKITTKCCKFTITGGGAKWVPDGNGCSADTEKVSL